METRRLNASTFSLGNIPVRPDAIERAAHVMVKRGETRGIPSIVLFSFVLTSLWPTLVHIGRFSGSRPDPGAVGWLRHPALWLCSE